MPIHPHIENAYIKLVDAFIERRPQPMPSSEKLDQCKLIAHRGEHRNGTAKENTLAAFDQAAQSGVWGIELDVRWTQDLIPVVAHDADTQRVFGKKCNIARTTHGKLKRRFPQIASLDEVVTRFGKQVHLMIEIKQHEWIDRPRQGDILAEVLRPLDPKIDYHLLSLTPQALTGLPQITPTAKVPIAYYLPDRISRQVIENRWGGLCGHYLMMRRTIIAKHKALGQIVGSGFADSNNSLLRELNRGIDWIFSNNAARMQAFIDTCRSTLT